MSNARFPLLALASGLAVLPLVAQTDRVPLDNEYVRVVRAMEQPGRVGQPHSHPNNRVMIYVEGGQQHLISTEDGKVRDLTVKAGDVLFDPAVKMHTSQNTSKDVFHIIEVELKQPGGEAVTYPDLDPLKVDPKHYTLLFENSQVRVLRARYGPGEKSPMHHHMLKRVSVMLTPQSVKLTMPDGSTRESHRPVGDVVWGPDPAQHAEQNLSAEPYEAVLVELKSK
jgi:uncharacterized RmlC-like cupin family protein